MKDMTTGREGKHIVMFAVPMLIGNILQQLYSTVDGIIVGRVIGPEALAAVGVSAPIVFLLVALMLGLGMGASILISQFFGAQDYKRVAKTCDTIIVMTWGLTIVFTILGVLLTKPLLLLIKTPDAIMAEATIYLRVTFYGLIGLVGYNMLSAIFRGLGDSKTPLYLLFISTVINIGLDIYFIAVLDMGVFGAALATIIAQFVSFAIGIIYINKKENHVLKIKIRGNQFDKRILKEMLRIGLPSSVQQTIVGVSILVMQVIYNSFGPVVIAAYTIGVRIQMFAFMPILSMNMAASSFTGQNIGAGLMDRVMKGYKASLRITITISLIIMGSLLLWGRQLVSLFLDTNVAPDQMAQVAQVSEIAYKYVATISPFLIFASIMFITIGTIRGAGDTFFPMLITVIALVCVRIPLALILSRTIGYQGIFFAIGADWTVGALVSVIYFAKGPWKTKAFTSKLEPVIEDGATDNRAEIL